MMPHIKSRSSSPVDQIFNDQQLCSLLFWYECTLFCGAQVYAIEFLLQLVLWTATCFTVTRMWPCLWTCATPKLTPPVTVSLRFHYSKCLSGVLQLSWFLRAFLRMSPHPLVQFSILQAIKVLGLKSRNCCFNIVIHLTTSLYATLSSA